MRTSKLLGVTAIAAILLSTAACSSSSKPKAGGTTNPSSGTSTGSIKKGLKIAVIPKSINNPYFDAAYKGAKKACDEIGASCEQVGPTTATGAAQVQFINTVIQQHYNAIVISAADADSVTPALKRAQAAGIAVVTYDADVNDTSARSAMIKPTTPKQIADAQVKWACDAVGSGGGDAAILSAAATAENQNAWIKIMKADVGTCPGLKIVDTVYGDDDSAKSAQKAASLMQAHPNLKVIIAPTTVGVREAAKYIDGSKYKGKVQVTGLGLPSEMRTYIKDGTSKTVGLWDPGMLGYVGVYAAATKASGGDVSSSVKAGDKDYSFDATEKAIIIGPPAEFTATTVDNYTF